MAKTTKPKGATPAAKAPSRKKSGSKAGDTLKAKQAAAGPPRQPGVEGARTIRCEPRMATSMCCSPSPCRTSVSQASWSTSDPASAQLPSSPGPGHIRHAAQPADRRKASPATQETGRRAPTFRAWRSDRPAVPHHRGQRQRGGAPLRLGQRRPDRRRAQVRGFPDRDRVGSYRGTAQGPGTLHHQGPPGPGHRHRGQALGRPYPQRRSGAISLTDRPAAKPTPQFSYQSGSWTRSFLLTSPSEQSETTF